MSTPSDGEEIDSSKLMRLVPLPSVAVDLEMKDESRQASASCWRELISGFAVERSGNEYGLLEGLDPCVVDLRLVGRATGSGVAEVKKGTYSRGRRCEWNESRDKVGGERGELLKNKKMKMVTKGRITAGEVRCLSWYLIAHLYGYLGSSPEEDIGSRGGANVEIGLVFASREKAIRGTLPYLTPYLVYDLNARTHMFCSFESPVCTHMVLSPLSVSHIRTDTQTPFSVHSYFIPVMPWRDPSEKSAQHRVLPGIPQPSPLASCRKTPPPSIGLLFHPRDPSKRPTAYRWLIAGASTGTSRSRTRVRDTIREGNSLITSTFPSGIRRGHSGAQIGASRMDFDRGPSRYLTPAPIWKSDTSICVPGLNAFHRVMPPPT
ncbi:hypothetical protein CCUS01_03964 [Colletotrichum cuscutae]|uniref:Uncharacterized protein n=1 Tax=Colletotrichum cuscutae TaxID=1209917 RepID=A0AAI9VI46_9PEZI|nr:hypothetical protein CCUS01_03964 [Colletotrichum cuscutae]